MKQLKNTLLTTCKRLAACIFETKDLDEFVSFLHDDIVWTDITIDQIYKGKHLIKDVLKSKYLIQADKYEIQKQDFEVTPITEEQGLVYGSFVMMNHTDKTVMKLNLSGVFMWEKERFHLVYLNTGVPLSSKDYQGPTSYSDLVETHIVDSIELKDTSDFKIAMDHTNELLVTVDIESTKLVTSKSKFEDFFGVQPIDQYYFRPLLIDLGIVYEQDLDKVFEHSNFANIKHLSDANIQFSYYEFRINHPKDGLIWISENIIPVKDDNGKLVKVLARFRNIHEQKQQELNRREQLKTDIFTGLYNKNYVITAVNEYLATPKRFSSSSILIMDVDNFKEINDTKGHLFGDKAIAVIANILKQEFRTSDIVGRFGGDEFIVFMKDLQTKSIVENKAQKLIERFKDPIIIDNQSIHVSISIGISFYPLDGTTFDELFEKADMALYKSKHSGKNQWRYYDDTF